MRRVLFAVLLIATFAAAAQGATLRVPKDFNTIQEAIDAAEEGDVIRVKKGTYTEAVSIPSKRDLTLKAQGKVILDGEGDDDPLRVLACRNVLIQGFEVVNAVNIGIFIWRSDGCRVTKCRVIEPGTHGIVLEESVDTRIDKCSIDTPDGNGIVILDLEGFVPPANCTIEKCRLTECAGGAIFVEGEEHVIRKNRIDGCGGHGVEIGAIRTLCEKNRIANAVRGHGVAIERPACQVVKNRIDDPSDCGIYIGSDDCEVIGNVTNRAGRQGILVDSDDNLVAKNLVKSPGLDGIYVGETNNRIEKNMVKGCNEAAFRLKYGGNFIIRNRANKCVVDISDDDSGNNTYEKNSFDPPPSD